VQVQREPVAAARQGEHILEGNPNKRSKAEIKEKADNEVVIGDLDFTPSESLLKRKDALKIWYKKIKMIVDSGYMLWTTNDSDIIENYCIAIADKNKAEINRKGNLSDKAANREINQLAILIKDLHKALGFDFASRLNAIKKQNKKPEQKPDKFNKAFGGI